MPKKVVARKEVPRKELPPAEDLESEKDATAPMPNQVDEPTVEPDHDETVKHIDSEAQPETELRDTKLVKDAVNNQSTKAETPILPAGEPAPETQEEPDHGEVVEHANNEDMANVEAQPTDPNTTGSSMSKPESRSPFAPSADTYLDLLNKVARGEISPQALQQILQGSGTRSAAEAASEAAKT